MILIDDVGLQVIDNPTRQALMNFIDDCFYKSSTIVWSQKPVLVWYDIIGKETSTGSILDWLIDSLHRIDLIGES